MIVQNWAHPTDVTKHGEHMDGKAFVIKNHGANDTLNNPVSPQSEMDYQAV